MYVRPSAPLSIGGVVDDAIRLYRGSFSHTWKLSVAFAIVLAALGLFMVMTIPALFDIQRATMAPQQVLALFTSPVVMGSYLLMILCEFVFFERWNGQAWEEASGVPAYRERIRVRS